MRGILDFRGIFSNVNTRNIYLFSILIGASTGLGAVVFSEVLHQLTDWTMGTLARMPVPQPHGEGGSLIALAGPPRRWLLILMPVVGGLVAGALVRAFAPEAEGTGTDAYIDAFHNKGGVMRARVPLVKSLATLATLASGGSAGKEGPVAQIGAGIGSALGGALHMGARARRTLMVAGAAAGLGAIFRAPLGGALTAVEVLYKEDLETDALTPAILASVTAYTVFCSVNGFQHVFAFHRSAFRSPAELVFYAALGLVCAGAGYLFVRLMHGSKRAIFDRLGIDKYLVPPLGGLMVGLIGFWHPEVLGQGLGYVQQLIRGEAVGATEATFSALALLAVLKIMTTSFTIASGGSGGVFAPSLFIGAMLGSCVGRLSHALFPDLVTDVAPFAVVGMGAFFAGVANAPIASLLMVCELTGAYELLPPLMVVATVALVTSRRWSIYTNQVDNKFFSRAHLWEMNPNVLRHMTIGSMTHGSYDRHAIVPNDMPLKDVLALCRTTHETDLVLQASNGDLAGLVSMRDVDVGGDAQLLDSLVLAQDLVNRRTVFLRPEDNLISALEFFGDRAFDKLPIVDVRDGHRHLLGHVEYDDILEFYRRERREQESAEAATAAES